MSDDVDAVHRQRRDVCHPNPRPPPRIMPLVIAVGGLMGALVFGACVLAFGLPGRPFELVQPETLARALNCPR
jgi:hypothetical protein